MNDTFHEAFVDLFNGHFRRLYRYLDRVSGDPDLAADLAQDTFVRLYQRGSLPDQPEAWLITVAMNLFRNARTKQSRHLRLLAPVRAEVLLADPPPSPADEHEGAESRERVRRALDRLAERERHLLLLHAEGYRYRDIAIALELNEASVGTLLARARRAFREQFENLRNAS